MSYRSYDEYPGDWPASALEQVGALEDLWDEATEACAVLTEERDDWKRMYRETEAHYGERLAECDGLKKALRIIADGHEFHTVINKYDMQAIARAALAAVAS